MANRLAKTNIEYGDLAWNFYPGCLHKPGGLCPVPKCWAESLTKRYPHWGDFHQPHLIPEMLLAPLHVKKPARILVNFMGDLGGDWVDPYQELQMTTHDFDGVTHTFDFSQTILLSQAVFKVVEDCPQHTFFFLSKNPSAWQEWGKWPDNAWVGATVCSNGMMTNALTSLRGVHADKKWLSIEPLLGMVGMKDHMRLKDAGISWVVIGAQTNPVKQPRLEWLNEIVDACDRAGIPVWLKNNLGWLKLSCEGALPQDVLGTMMLRQVRQG